MGTNNVLPSSRARRLFAKETMINMKFSVAIMTLVACLAYSAKIDNGADREKREESADKDLAGLKNLAKFEALNVKTRHARDQLRQDASCSDCNHCPKCKTHCPAVPTAIIANTAMELLPLAASGAANI